MRLARVKRMAALPKALKAKKKEHAAGVQRGLTKAALMLFRWSQELVPVQTGNLKASGTVRREGTGFGTIMVIAYTANYAIYVHEDLELRHGQEFNDWYGELIADPHSDKKIWFNRGVNQQAKFLERPFRENFDRLLEIIREEVGT